MDGWLKQSTAVTVKIGPFLDSANGDTEETGLTISQADVRLSKNGGNMAQKNESTSCTHDELGVYDCPLDTTDTGTLGRLQLYVHESGGLSVWHNYMVVPANVWDSLFGADYLQTHAVEITNGLITAAAIADDAIDAGSIATGALTADAFAADAIVAATLATGAITADAFAANAIVAATLAADCITEAKIADNAIAAEHLAASAIDFATFAADCKTGTGLKANVESITAGAITAAAIATGAIDADAIADNAIDAGAIAAGAITNAKFAAGAIDATAIANGAIDAATFAAGAIDAAAIANGAIDNATFAADVGSTAYATNIIALAADKAILNTSALASVCTEARLSELDAGTGGKMANQVDIIQTDTTTDIPAILGTPAGDSISADIAVIEGYTDDIGVAGAGLTAVPWNAAWDAQVQSEVFDALDAEITDATALTANGLLDRLRAVMWILRNKIEVADGSGTTKIYKDDSTTVAFQSPDGIVNMLTDNSTTTTRLRAA